jgi:hypothetical protein
MADLLPTVQKIQTDFANLYGQGIVPHVKDMDKRSPLYRSLYQLGILISNFKKQLATTKTSSFVEALIVIADELDQCQQPDLADRMDSIIQRSRENESVVEDLIEIADRLDFGGNSIMAEAIDYAIGIRKTAEEQYIPGGERVLSSRYCPQHRGVQVIRVAENTFQCPIDGIVYSHEQGYQMYNGKIVPGGSIANQTPETSDHGIPMMFYDSRDSVLRSMY